MVVSFASAFSRQLEKLDPHVKLAAKRTVSRVMDFYASQERTPGLGIKRLRRDFWEARSGLRIRILYRLEGDSLCFVAAGTHDDVRRYLASL